MDRESSRDFASGSSRKERFSKQKNLLRGKPFPLLLKFLLIVRRATVSRSYGFPGNADDGASERVVRGDGVMGKRLPRHR